MSSMTRNVLNSVCVTILPLLVIIPSVWYQEAFHIALLYGFTGLKKILTSRSTVATRVLHTISDWTLTLAGVYNSATLAKLP